METKRVADPVGKVHICQLVYSDEAPLSCEDLKEERPTSYVALVNVTRL